MPVPATRARAQQAEHASADCWAPASAICHAEFGNHELALALAFGAMEQAADDELFLQKAVQGMWRARVLRTVGGPAGQDALETQFAETKELESCPEHWMEFASSI
jgi:hypothetical protein